MQVKYLTIEELKAAIRETVIESLEDLLPDPDAPYTAVVWVRAARPAAGLEGGLQRLAGASNRGQWLSPVWGIACRRTGSAGGLRSGAAQKAHAGSVNFC